MKYEKPVMRTSNEILDTLNRTDISSIDRVGVVLSAVYYGETVEFSGDLLIKEFSEASYEEQISLENIFKTFYQMCQTTYRIDESISLLEKYKMDHQERASLINSIIDELIEYKEIFGNY